MILGMSSQAFGQETVPFALTSYGDFKKMMRMKETAGVVDLQKAVDLPHVFAVGATAQGIGEITVIDGEPWLDYGSDGLGNAQKTIPAGEEALLLVRSQVEEWHSVQVPRDMELLDLHLFILSQAEVQGLDREKPFPFLLEGTFGMVDWHVLNGVKQMPSDHNKDGIFNKLHEHREKTSGTVVGFFSAANQGEYTHPGESWHLHMLLKEEGKAGHIDALSVRQGTILKLPVIVAQ